MEEGIPRKPYKVSHTFNESRKQIYDYSVETFGEVQAVRYLNKIRSALDTLPVHYLSYSPCRHIPTKDHRYRNIILDAHLIIYRVTKERIEVLDILHQASSPTKIRKTRSIQV
jgi:plasmid stabilization system protein ParE